MKNIYIFLLLCLCLHAGSHAHSGEWISAKMADFQALILATKNQVTTHLETLKKTYFGGILTASGPEEKPIHHVSSTPKSQEHNFESGRAHYYGIYPKTGTTKNFYTEKQFKTIKALSQSIFTDKKNFPRTSGVKNTQGISSHQNFNAKQKEAPSEPSLHIDIDFASLSIDQLDQQIRTYESEYYSKAHGTQLRGASLVKGETFPQDIVFKKSKSFRFIDTQTGNKLTDPLDYQTQLYRTRRMLESKNTELEKIGRRLDEMTALLREKTQIKRERFNNWGYL